MILRWAAKDLIRARARALSSTFSVGAAFALVILFRGIWEGETRQLAAYLDNAGADVWVMQPGVSNVHMATSFISDGRRVEISRVPGVAELAGILYLNTMVQVDGDQWFSYVVGIEDPSQMGGPWRITQGRSIHSCGEAVIPDALAGMANVSIGDNVSIAGQQLEIVGLSGETFSATNPVSFVHATDLGSLLSLSGYDSYILVRAEPDVDPRALVRRIRREVDGVEVLTKDELVANDLQLARQMGSDLIALMTWISAALATLLVGFSLFIHTSHNRKSLATLKAVGFTNLHVYQAVTLHALVLTFLAFILAAGVVAVFAEVADRFLSTITVQLTSTSLLQIASVGIGVATTSTLVLARGISHVDPMTVFRS